MVLDLSAVRLDPSTVRLDPSTTTEKKTGKVG
jgi:hypothetical protein